MDRTNARTTARRVLMSTALGLSGAPWAWSMPAVTDGVRPSVEVSAPAEGMTTTASTVAVSGHVTATAKSLQVTCNGRPAVVVKSIVRCTVPLTIGVNAVVLHAIDGSGNGSSAGVRVIRKAFGTGVNVFPTTLALGRNEEGFVVASTSSGLPAVDVGWSTSNPNVLSVASYSSVAQIAPKAPGRATVTARVNGRSATASVTVLELAGPRSGTTVWSVAPLAGLVARPPVNASRIDDEGPDLFAVDADPAKQFTVMRGLTARGGLVWTGTIPGTPLFGDRFGGLVAQLGRLDRRSRTIARFDRPNSPVPVWRFEARGEIADIIQTGDGTIYLVEHVSQRDATGSRHNASNIVVIDGQSGFEKARYLLPQSTMEVEGSCVSAGAFIQSRSELGPLSQATDGAAYVEIVEAHDRWKPRCEQGAQLVGRGNLVISRTLKIVRVTPTGAEPVCSLWHSETEGPDGPDRLKSLEEVAPGPTAITREQQIVAFWTHVDVEPDGLTGQLHVSLIADGTVLNDVARVATFGRASRTWRVLLDAYESPWVHLSDGTTLEAIDLAENKSQWKIRTAAVPYEAVDGRHIVVDDVARRQLLGVDATGFVEMTVAASVTDPRIISQGQGALHGVDPITHSVVEVREPDFVESGWFSTFAVEESFTGVRRRLVAFGLLRPARR